MKAKDLNQTKICAQLWNGVTIKTDGTAGICCEVTEELTGTNVKTHTFEQMQRHPHLASLRAQMLNGEEPKECWRCFSKEKHGIHTLRHTLNEVYEKLNGDFDPEFIEPQNLEFVLGNLCQLRCVMCNPVRSKKTEEAHQYIKLHDMRKSFEGNIMPEPLNLDVNWVEDPNLWDSIARQSLTARRIFINGGEPLLAKEHEKVLDRLIENGVAAQTTLVYSTNGLLLEQKHFEKWREFKSVSVAFSLDDLGDRNHFIRYPSDWGQVVSALDKIKVMQEDPRNKNIYVSLWCAINMLSFVYLPEYLDFLGKNYPRIGLGWRAIQSPDYLNPVHLPCSVKERYVSEIRWRLVKYFPKTHLADEINMIVDAQGDPRLFADGVTFMKSNARFQGVDLQMLFPKLDVLLR